MVVKTARIKKQKVFQKVFIACSERYDFPLARYGQLEFSKTKFLNNPKQYRLVVLTGGEDIHPGLYGQIEIDEAKFNNPIRDMKELFIANLAIAHGIPIIGICRGAQLLNIIGGGSLIQHCDNHNLWHKMTVIQNKTMVVSSTHHQMMVPPPGAKVIGWASKRESTLYKTSKKRTNKPAMEAEIVFLPKIKALAFQYHPEYMKESSVGVKYFNWAIQKYLKVTPAPTKARDTYISLPKSPITRESLAKEEEIISGMNKKELDQYDMDQLMQSQRESSVRSWMSQKFPENVAEAIAEEEMEQWLEAWTESQQAAKQAAQQTCGYFPEDPTDKESANKVGLLSVEDEDESLTGSVWGNRGEVKDAID